VIIFVQRSHTQVVREQIANLPCTSSNLVGCLAKTGDHSFGSLFFFILNESAGSSSMSGEYVGTSPTFGETCDYVKPC